jgi:hypothetical protein
MKALLLSIFILPTAFASITNEDFNYNIDITSTGAFTITINESFQNMSAKEVMKKHYLNSAMQRKIDATITSLVTNKNLNSIVSKSSSRESYSLKMKAKKSGVTATFKNTCFLSTGNSITNSCKITSARAFIVGTVMERGSNKTTCQNQGYGSQCTTVITGKPSKISFPIQRTAERLAVSGATRTIEGYFKGHYFMKNNTFSGHKNERFHINNISGIWKKMINHLRGEQHLSYDIVASSSDSGASVKAK